MSQRIRQLEDALAITTNHSEPNHPLLADELLSIKFGPETREDSMLTESDEPQEEDHQHPEDLLQAMGTLGADSQGELRYFGASGGSSELELLHHTRSPTNLCPPPRCPTDGEPELSMHLWSLTFSRLATNQFLRISKRKTL